MIHRVRIGRVTPRLEYRPMVSDHAVVRYIERVLGLEAEVAELRRTIADDVQMAVLHRQKGVRIDMDHVFVLRGQKVVTVLNGRRSRSEVFP